MHDPRGDKFGRFSGGVEGFRINDLGMEGSFVLPLLLLAASAATITLPLLPQQPQQRLPPVPPQQLLPLPLPLPSL